MSGIKDFSTTMLTGGVWLDGTYFRGGAGGSYPLGSQFSTPGGANLLRTLAGTTIAQDIWVGGDAPLNLRPMNVTMSFSLTKESDFWLFQEAVGYGRPVQTWLDLPVSDQWYLPAANGDIFKTSRILPWSISGISHATRPPAAFIDGVSKTIVTSGTPTTSEIKIPDTGGDFGLVEKASASSGTRLIVRYAPIFLFSYGQLQITYQDTNHIRFNVTVQEHLGNIYSPGSSA